jgi:hypothetical protein
MGGKERAACGGRLMGTFMPNSFINDPAHWLQRAAETRALAQSMTDPQSKEAMLRIAQDYEHLAERAKLREKARHNQSSPLPGPDAKKYCNRAS